MKDDSLLVCLTLGGDPVPSSELIPSSTDPQTWLTQTLSVCESSLLIAGQ